MGRFLDALGTTAANFLLKGDPTTSLAAATKQYVDGKVLTQGVLYASGTPVIVSNTAVETDVLSCTIPGGTLGANGAIGLRLAGKYLNGSGATKTLRIKVKLGGQTLYDATSAALTSVASLYHALSMDFQLYGAHSTGAQVLGGDGVSMAASTAVTAGLGPTATFATASSGMNTPVYGAGAVDMTADQTLEVSVTHSAAATTTTVEIDAVNVALIGVGIQGPAGAQGGASQDYISGLQLGYVDATHISVGSGTAYNQGLGGVVNCAGFASVAIAFPAASTWYHVYLLSDGTIRITTAAPLSPYFGTARSQFIFSTARYLGSVLTDASANVIPFVHAAGNIFYKAPGNHYRVLDVGTATTSTNLSCTSYVPVTATVGLFQSAMSGAAGLNAYFTEGDVTANQFTAFAITNAVGTDYARAQIRVPLDSSQSINYAVQSGASAFLDVIGYEFVR